MNNRINACSAIGRTVRYVEWTLLVVMVLVLLFLMLLDRNLDQPPRLLPNWMLFTLLGACGFLSFFFPIDSPLWQRRAYVLLEMLLIVPTPMTGWDLGLLLYLFIGKSCFLLNRKDVAITVIATGIAWNITSVCDLLYNFAEKSKFRQTHAADLYNLNRMLPGTIITNTGVYIAASIFVVLFSFVALAEQKSRQRAEALTLEVETLAATLERSRIARDIHDSLGHTLTTLDVQLELAQKLRDSNPSQALEALDTAKILANQCLQDVRRAVQTMRSSDFHLNQALITLVEQVRQNHAFTIDLDVNLPPLPLRTSHQLYCIIQEGLTNIQKHAHANHVHLRSASTAKEVTVELTDDGCGFDSQQPHSGYGLRGIQERVQILGGKLTINSIPDRGTHIQVVIPR